MDKIYRCSVVCTFRVKDTLEEHNPYGNDNPSGFKRPDGSIIRPIIGLELASKDESRYKNVVSESDMAKLGLDDLDYDLSDVEEDESLSEQLEHEEYEAMPVQNLPANLEPRFESTKVIIERRLREKK